MLHIVIERPVHFFHHHYQISHSIARNLPNFAAFLNTVFRCIDLRFSFWLDLGRRKTRSPLACPSGYLGPATGRWCWWERYLCSSSLSPLSYSACDWRHLIGGFGTGIANDRWISSAMGFAIVTSSGGFILNGQCYLDSTLGLGSCGLRLSLPDVILVEQQLPAQQTWAESDSFDLLHASCHFWSPLVPWSTAASLWHWLMDPALMNWHQYQLYCWHIFRLHLL